MATVATIRDAIQDRLDTVSGLKAYDVATGAERMPCALVFPAGVERMTAGGNYRYRFVVEAWVPLSAGLRHAQDVLDGFIDPEASTSLEAAIEADRTLGGIATSTRVDGFESYGFGALNDEMGTANALTARIPVEVFV